MKNVAKINRALHSFSEPSKLILLSELHRLTFDEKRVCGITVPELTNSVAKQTDGEVIFSEQHARDILLGVPTDSGVVSQVTYNGAKKPNYFLPRDRIVGNIGFNGLELMRRSKRSITEYTGKNTGSRANSSETLTPRLAFMEHALEGKLDGVSKNSWVEKFGFTHSVFFNLKKLGLAWETNGEYKLDHYVGEFLKYVADPVKKLALGNVSSLHYTKRLKLTAGPKMLYIGAFEKD